MIVSPGFFSSSSRSATKPPGLARTVMAYSPASASFGEEHSE